ncbi:hypothetical protein [Amycolatopsis sp. NPDC004625]|uniref:hypothetical protein n=1 Tax=Amycolatopsis sp. NPDC004625 TaxID=3154670 RepID=UPI0033A3FA90
MTIWIATLCGGVGGSIRGILALYRGITTWLQQRRTVLGSPLGRPRLADAADWTAELVGMAAQIVIGGLVGFFLTNAGTVTGVAGAILAGVSAPAILAQLGEVRLTQNLVAGATDDQVPPVADLRDDGVDNGVRHGE